MTVAQADFEQVAEVDFEGLTFEINYVPVAELPADYVIVLPAVYLSFAKVISNYEVVRDKYFVGFV